VIVIALVLTLGLQIPSACVDVADCRDRAEAAAARKEYETFHDLAWRAVQKGTPNDPSLMYLLARAQARSGRYGDAFVMLGRLADMKAPLDVLTNDDFARLRLLPQWAALEARIAGEPPPAATAVTPPAPVAAAPPGVAASAASAAPPAVERADDVSFDAPAAFEPFALAHDAVSRRFVIGDRAARRLLVVDEVSHNVVTYVTAATAGLLDRIRDFAVDARRGDLWVVSSAGEGEAETSALHKLQLISGRTLLDVKAPAGAKGVSLSALAIAGDGTVYAIDGRDGRLFRARPGARSLELVMRVDAGGVSAMASQDDHVLFVAAASGLVRVDVSARTSQPVKSGEQLTGFSSLVLRNGALLGIERVAGSFAVVRVPLEAGGTRASARGILAASVDPIVGTLAGETYYFLADRHVIRRVRVR